MVDNSRIKALDSLRGLASITVVIAHACGILIKGHTYDEYTPLYLFRAAHESVIFFFLLSGYVLTYQIYKQNYFNYKKFIIQRLFRIYIPYIVTIIFIFILYSYINNIKNPQRQLSFMTTDTYEAIINHIVLIGNFNTNDYDNVIWSLVHELRVALIFPVLLYIISFKWRNVLFFFLVSSLLVGTGVIFNINKSEGYNNSYLYTLHYFSFFIMGGYIVKYNKYLTDWFLELNPKTKRIILIITLLIFNYSRMIFLIPHKFKFFEISILGEFIADWFTAISAVFFIISAIHIKNQRNWLLHPVLLTFGKLSYSLYLVHLPIMLTFFTLYPNSNKGIVMLTSVISVIGFAFILNKYVEKPSAILGKKLGDIMSLKFD